MTPLQIKNALKIHYNQAEKEAEFERIAEQIGIDIEQLAQDIVAVSSPLGSRQIVRSIKPPSSENP
jgi:hypothetical protein